jgi:hypothetical protein
VVVMPTMFKGYVLCEVRAVGKETRHSWDSITVKYRLRLKIHFNSEHTIQQRSHMPAFRYMKLMLYLMQL